MHSKQTEITSAHIWLHQDKGEFVLYSFPSYCKHWLQNRQHLNVYGIENLLKLSFLSLPQATSTQNDVFCYIHEKDFYTDFLSFQARYSIWTLSVLVQRCFTRSWSHGSICNKRKLWYMHQFMLTFVGKKYRFGKKGTSAYTSHPFYGVTLKKKNVFFLVNRSLVFQAGNPVGK